MDQPEEFPSELTCANPVDWQFEMRREMQEIFDGCFLGPYAVAQRDQLSALQAKGITHIVCIRASSEARFLRENFPKQIVYLTLDLGDSDVDKLLPVIKPFAEFLDTAFAAGGRVLIHDNVGISQGPSFLTAYIMQKRRTSFSRALTYVQNKRFCVCPNEAFQQQLIQYEAICKAQNTCERRGEWNLPADWFG
eukprot:m.45363 g.45363  ORF g.45363 m.45363 type:complete len:193 (+) comp13085_c0_seq1:79-657(+)